MLTVALTAFVVAASSLWIWRRRQKLQLLKNMGIDGPPPSFFFGNFAELIRRGSHVKFREWHQRYGQVYGIYMGDQPLIITADPDMCHEILVKQFHKFVDRKSFILNSRSTEYVGMIDAIGDDWRRIRGVSSPAFTAKRMKEMMPLMQSCVVDLVDVLEQKCDEGKFFDVYKNLQSLTLDVIASTAFGFEIKSIKNENSEFLKEVRASMTFFEKKSPAFNLALVFFIIFPDPLHLIRRLFNPELLTVPRSFFHKAARAMIEQRIASGQHRPDFIELMLKAQKHEEADDNQENKPTKTMTMPEMVEQGYLFLLAGYETTSSTLAFIAYELALNPDAQLKLQKEIDSVFPEDESSPQYEQLQQLPYMDNVIKETMRLHPIAQLVQSRKCVEATEVLGMKVPKGLDFQINVREIHDSVELWGEDVLEFKPDRFSQDDGRHPMAWMPFGQGPRSCIGMRFAYLEMKLVLVSMLKRFTLVQCPETKIPLPVNENVMRSPSKGVHVKLQKRQ